MGRGVAGRLRHLGRGENSIGRDTCGGHARELNHNTISSLYH